MEIIKAQDIDFSSLRKLKNQGSQSTIYTDGIMCYKILDGLYPEEKKELYKKFLAMDGIRINGVLLPEDLIMEDGSLKGYTMDYFADSTSLSDKFFCRYFNCRELFDYVDKASRILRDIHKKEIFCQDLSFENILVNDHGEVMFCDMDGCTYKDYNSPFLSLLLKEFLIDYRKSTVPTVEDVDKLSMILSFFAIMYGNVIQKISKKQYHTLSDRIKTLENLRDTANMLVDKHCPISELPYLDEVIDRNDNYDIDRKKLLTLRQVFNSFKH